MLRMGERRRDAGANFVCKQLKTYLEGKKEEKSSKIRKLFTLFELKHSSERKLGK